MGYPIDKDTELHRAVWMGLEMLKQLDQFTAGAGKENIAQAAKEARKLNWLFGTKAINTQLSQLTDRGIEIIGLQSKMGDDSCLLYTSRCV